MLPSIESRRRLVDLFTHHVNNTLVGYRHPRGKQRLQGAETLALATGDKNLRVVAVFVDDHTDSLEWGSFTAVFDECNVGGHRGAPTGHPLAPVAMPVEVMGTQRLVVPVQTDPGVRTRPVFLSGQNEIVRASCRFWNNQTNQWNVIFILINFHLCIHFTIIFIINIFKLFILLFLFFRHNNHSPIWVGSLFLETFWVKHC